MGKMPGLLALLPLCMLAAMCLLVGPSQASSYSGSGDWTIPLATSETVTGETLSISGNLTVAGSLTLVNTTLTVDRNVTVSGRLTLANTSLTFTVDGPGTNYLDARSGAVVSLLDLDANAATRGDGSRLVGTPFAFNATFGANASLTILNSQVRGAGWARQAPFVLGPGFLLAGARLNVSGSTFLGGFELFVLSGADNLSVVNSTFDGFVSAVNLTGGSGHRFTGLSIVNHTFGLRIANASGVVVDRVDAGPTAAQSYFPPFAPPSGTAVAFGRVDASRISNLTVRGIALSPAPRNVTGFQLGNSTRIDVDGFFGRWGDAVGQIGFSGRVSLSNFDAENFTQPLEIVSSNNVSLLAGRFVGERTGVAVAQTSDFDFRAVVALRVQGAFLTASGPSGLYSIQDLAITDCPVGVLIQGTPASLLLFNVRVTNATMAVQIDGSSLQTTIDTLTVAGIGSEAVRATFVDAFDFALRNLTATNVSGLTLNFTATNASRISLADWRVRGTNSTVGLVDAQNLSGLSGSRLWASFHAGSLLRIEADSMTDVTLSDILSTNSSGSVLLVNGGAITRLQARNITLISGDVPPITQAPGAVSLDATGQGGAHPQGSVSEAVVDGLLVNVSNRGGLYLAGQGTGSLSASNISMTGAQFEGVRLNGGGGAWTIALSHVSYRQSGGVGVRLENLAGAVLTDIEVDAPTGVQLEATQQVAITDLRYNGSYTALLAANCVGLSVTRLTASGGFAVDAASCFDVTLTDLNVQASVFALRAVGSARWRVDGLHVADSTSGVTLRGSSDFLFTNLSVEFSAQGFVATVASANVTLLAPNFSTPLAKASLTLFEASYANGVHAENLTFRGTCAQAALVQYSSRVELLGFDAATCGVGVEVASTRTVRLTGLRLAGAFNGSALTLSASTDVTVEGGNLSGAAESALVVVGSDRAILRDLDGRGARAEGALLAFVSNLTLDTVDLGGAGGAGLRLLYGGPNVTLRRVSARGAPAGFELLASPGATMDGVDASDEGGIGVYVDPLSPGVVLRNITARRNFGGGLLVAVNGTRLIDGNFSANLQSAFGVAPLVRLDWTVEGLATLEDEAVDLTGDLTVAPGGALRVARSNVTVEQTARLRALQGYMRITLGAGGLLRFENSSLFPRDSAVPFSLQIGAGASFELENATLRGGARGDATSSINATGARLSFLWALLEGWYAPLRAVGASFNGTHCTFTQNGRGPEFVGGRASISDLGSTLQSGDGLAASQGAQVAVVGAFVAYNGGRGAAFESDSLASLSLFTALSNSLGGIAARGGVLVGAGVAVNKSGGPGLLMVGGRLLDLSGFFAVDNAGAGASVVGTSEAFLALGLLRNNTGQGIYLEGVANASITGGRIEQSGVFGLQALNVGRLLVEGTTLSGDAAGAIRVEGAGVLFLVNASITTDADHAVLLLGSTDATVSDCLLSGLTAGLLATESTRAFVLNSSMGDPTVSMAGEVTIGWNLRVLVQDPLGFPAPGTLVRLTDRSPLSGASAFTLEGGASPLLQVWERTLRGDGSTVRYDPTVVEAAHPTLGRARTSLNVTHYTAVGLRLDNGTPLSTASFDRTAGPTGWFQEPVTLSLRTADDRSEGVLLVYCVNGGPCLNASGSADSVFVVLPFALEGSSRVEFYGVDFAGNEEPHRNVTVRIDLAAPTVVFGQAQNFTALSTPVSLTWSGSDPAGSGIESFVVTYTFRGNTTNPWPEGTREAGFPFALSEEGEYVFTLQAFDRAQRGSIKVTLAVEVRLTGIIHLTAREGGAALPSNVTVTLVELNRTTTGLGPIDLAGVPPGNFTLRVSAQGFLTFERAVTVRAGETTQVEVVLDRDATGGALDLTAAYLGLGALLLFTGAYYVIMRRKWALRAKARQAETDALGAKKKVDKPKGPQRP